MPVPITIDDLPELLRLLREHPEWRDALRATLLTEELLQLPALTERRFAELASAIERLTERQERTEAALAELAARQAETEARLATLTQRVEELAARQAETEATVARLAERMDQLTEQVSVLAERAGHLDTDVAELKQFHLEATYRVNGPAIFGGPEFRRPRVLSPTELDALLTDAVEAGTITWAERKAIMQADLVVRGRTPEADQLYLVVEVSWGVGTTDIARAIERAHLLRKAGFPARPAVAGRWLSPDAQRMLDALSGDDRPVIVLDGTVEWDGRG
ncbi:hypothetical protein NET02_14310 [Thermomicrobiaceae bacterium CFH 74404]|uniref:DUF3782 domain-containing protein n=1 Tax=Thermalbibacter longus TaxID=2951981 RepID=A0AA41WFV2_9BACT|nr:hypothetical protein [Thermalbibacter longus]MCM8750323.1 hypothetical protein [Thermalbibacter longus]